MTTRICQVMPAVYALPLPGEPIPVKYRVGSLCHKGHDWDGTGHSLRYAKTRGACVVCARAGAIERQERRKQADPDFSAKAAAWISEKRQRKGRPSRSRHSLLYTARADADTRAMRVAITTAGRLPSVAQLVYDQQREHWRRHPEERKAFALAKSTRQHRWRYMTDEIYRLYHRQKSKRRKAVMRDSVGIQLTGKQVQRRFDQFDHRCAYCGATGDLHIEHVVPISQGGTHALGNIIPACQGCNFKKAAKEAETWYRAQPFFTEQRWRKICRVLGWAGSSVGQLALL